MHNISWKITLFILTVTSVLMSSGYTMLIPFLPMYLIQELGVSAQEVNNWSGLIFSISFLISGLMAPVWGAMADKKSRKAMALRAAVCLAITYFLGAMVRTPWELFAVRIIQGFSAGLWPAILSIMSGIAPTQRLGFCMGMMQGGLTAGHVVGPFLGGLVAEVLGMRACFVVAGVSLMVITLAIVFFIREPERRKAPAHESKAQAREVLKNPVIQRMLFAGAMVQLTILMTQPVLPLYIADLQGSMDRIVFITGMVFSIVGFSGIFASPLWGIAGQKFGFRPALYVSMFLGGVFGVVQAIPFDLTQFTLWRFVGGLAFAGIFPSINAVLTQTASPDTRGRVFGYSYCAQQIGSVIGPLLGSFLALYVSNQIVIGLAGALLFPVVALLFFCRPKSVNTSNT